MAADFFLAWDMFKECVVSECFNSVTLYVCITIDVQRVLTVKEHRDVLE